MHGGVGASLVDVATIATLMDEDGVLRKVGLSAGIKVSYVGAIRPGETLLLDARALKVGRRLAFAECVISKEEGGAIVLKGSHTIVV